MVQGVILTEANIANRRIRLLCDALFREHSEALTRFAFKRLNSWDGAADVVQSAFERLFRQDTPPPIRYLRAYIYKTVARLCSDVVKQRKNHSRAGRDAQIYEAIYGWAESNMPAPDDEALSQQLHDMLNEGVTQLPARCRMAFTSVELEGKSIRACAIAMRVEEMTVYKLINRAYAHLGRLSSESLSKQK